MMNITKMNNIDEYELLDILLNQYKAIVVEIKDHNRPFLDRMCDSGYLVNYNNIEDKKYYHVNNKFRNKILSILKAK